MHNEFTAIIELDGDWYIAYCPEIPGALGQKYSFVYSTRQPVKLLVIDAMFNFKK